MWEPGEEDEVAEAGEDEKRVAPKTKETRETWEEREARETRAREELAAVTRESSTAQDSGISSTSDSTVSYSPASRGQGKEDLSTVPWYEAEMPRWVPRLRGCSYLRIYIPHRRRPASRYRLAHGTRPGLAF